MAKEEKREERVDSPERAAFKKLIEAYAKQNPVKFQAKKAELEKKLAEIK